MVPGYPFRAQVLFDERSRFSEPHVTSDSLCEKTEQAHKSKSAAGPLDQPKKLIVPEKPFPEIKNRKTALRLHLAKAWIKHKRGLLVTAAPMVLVLALD